MAWAVLAKIPRPIRLGRHTATIGGETNGRLLLAGSRCWLPEEGLNPRYDYAQT